MAWLNLCFGQSANRRFQRTPEQNSFRDIVSAVATIPVDPHVFKGEEAVETELFQASQHAGEIDCVFVDGGLQPIGSASAHVDMRSEWEQIVYTCGALARHNEVPIVKRQRQPFHSAQKCAGTFDLRRKWIRHGARLHTRMPALAHSFIRHAVSSAASSKSLSRGIVA